MDEVLYVARQPILDRRGHVYGYELLYRAGRADQSFSGAPAQATARILSEGITGLNLDVLCHGRRAFLNMPLDVLLLDAASGLPANQAVFEILEDVPVTPEVIAVCRSLRQQGYGIALDDFVPGSAAEALIEYATHVKVDVLAVPGPDVATLATRLPPRVSLVAEKVETAGAHASAMSAGCGLFQGYYFCRPETHAVRPLSPNHTTQLRLMTALMQPSVTVVAIEELLKQDPRLSYQVLRMVNSAGFGLRREVNSIREALVLMGLEPVRKWAALWALAGLNSGPSELVTMTVVRARTCETLGSAIDSADEQYFLLGLCSLLDVLVGQPMDRVIDGLPVGGVIRDALLGVENRARSVLCAVASYERGDWHEADRLTTAIGLGADALPGAHAAALEWARKVQGDAADSTKRSRRT